MRFKSDAQRRAVFAQFNRHSNSFSKRSSFWEDMLKYATYQYGIDVGKLSVDQVDTLIDVLKDKYREEIEGSLYDVKVQADDFLEVIDNPEGAEAKLTDILGFDPKHGQRLSPDFKSILNIEKELVDTGLLKQVGYRSDERTRKYLKSQPIIDIKPFYVSIEKVRRGEE